MVSKNRFHCGCKNYKKKKGSVIRNPIKETSTTRSSPTSPPDWIAQLCKTRADASGEALARNPGSDVRAAAGLLPSLLLPCMLQSAFCGLSTGSTLPALGIGTVSLRTDSKKSLKPVCSKCWRSLLRVLWRMQGDQGVTYGFLGAHQGDQFT